MTHLYRHFDQRGKLLYVGISSSAPQRLCAHKRSKWFARIKSVSIQAFRTRAKAKRAESDAVKTENPLFNVQLRAKLKPAAREPKPSGLPVYWVEGDRVFPSRGAAARFFGFSSARLWQVMNKKPRSRRMTIVNLKNERPRIDLPKYECLRCGHRWLPRATHQPQGCPSCKSPYWNRPRRNGKATKKKGGAR